MDRLDRKADRVMRILSIIGFVCVMLMMLVVVINVILRPLGHSILSTFEAVEILISIAVSFALGYATLKKSHPSMDMLVNIFSKSTRKIFSIFSSFLGLVLWIPITWYSFRFAGEKLRISEHTEVAEFPVYPFRYIFAFGALLCCLLMILNIIKAIQEGKVND